MNMGDYTERGYVNEATAIGIIAGRKGNEAQRRSVPSDTDQACIYFSPDFSQEVLDMKQL